MQFYEDLKIEIENLKKIYPDLDVKYLKKTKTKIKYHDPEWPSWVKGICDYDIKNMPEDFCYSEDSAPSFRVKIQAIMELINGN
jgi:hypothetical protein